MHSLVLETYLNNQNFKVHEFVYFKNNAGSNSFNPSMSEWIERTDAKGIIAKRGRYGGTYAHKDIAFEFGTWLSQKNNQSLTMRGYGDIPQTVGCCLLEIRMRSTP